MKQAEPNYGQATRMARRTLIVAACIMVAGTLSGCVNPDWRALQQARLLWEANNVYSYSYDLQVVCFCPTDLTRPVRVVVQDDETVSVEYLDSEESKEVVPAGLFDEFDTINDLFDNIEEGVVNNAASVDADYDPTYGYPADVLIDEVVELADEEIGWTVENFVPFRSSP